MTSPSQNSAYNHAAHLGEAGRSAREEVAGSRSPRQDSTERRETFHNSKARKTEKKLTEISSPRRLRVKGADTDPLMGCRIGSGETGVLVADGSSFGWAKRYSERPAGIHTTATLCGVVPQNRPQNFLKNPEIDRGHSSATEWYSGSSTMRKYLDLSVGWGTQDARKAGVGYTLYMWAMRFKRALLYHLSYAPKPLQQNNFTTLPMGLSVGNPQKFPKNIGEGNETRLSAASAVYNDLGNWSNIPRHGTQCDVSVPKDSQPRGQSRECFVGVEGSTRPIQVLDRPSLTHLNPYFILACVISLDLWAVAYLVGRAIWESCRAGVLR